MPIIIHASRDFTKRYQCELSLPGEKVEQTGRLDSWSAHCVRISRTPMVLIMNDATLWSMVIPSTGVTTLSAVLTLFLNRISEIWASHGAAFDSSNQSVVFFSRSNRSLIGSMNDAVTHIRFEDQMAREEGYPIDWPAMETYLNRMPYGAMKYARPKDRMAALLAEEG